MTAAAAAGVLELGAPADDCPARQLGAPAGACRCPSWGPAQVLAAAAAAAVMFAPALCVPWPFG